MITPTLFLPTASILNEQTGSMAYRHGQFGRRRALIGVVIALSTVFATGCNSVQRRLTIQSNPPGAFVLVDGEEVGYTPASIDFTYYAEREITLIKDGYETLTTMQEFKAPPYQWFGVDFFSENLSPVMITNRQKVAYNLRPMISVPTDDLLDRAEMFRDNAVFGR
ncbi:PEGA domain-containing protein [Stratiformator vulcanicus]|nr:PEGA domain-containing protein [Stratiformator vulcanicus]